MSKETYYFKHDYNARADRKLVNVIMKYGMEGIGIYWCIVEMLYEEGGYLPLEYDRITFELRSQYEIVKSIINDFDLFKQDDNKFWSISVIERLDERCEKSIKARESINKRWKKYERITNVLQTNDNRNTKEEKKEEKKKEEKNKYADFVSMTEDQYKKLTTKHGEYNTKILIEILNNYKGANGKKYKDDYLAILNWVVDKAKQDGKFRTL